MAILCGGSEAAERDVGELSSQPPRKLRTDYQQEARQVAACSAIEVEQ